MKTLYYFRADAACATVFVDGTGKLVSSIHENDGEYSQEYMGFVAEHFGGKTVELTLEGHFVDAEEVVRFVELNRGRIFEAIAIARGTAPEHDDAS